MATKSGGNPLCRHGGVSYLEIPTLAPKRSAAFYAEVAGWNIDRRSDEDFRFSDRDGLLLGRFVAGRTIASAAGLVPILYVDNLDAAMGRITALGGEVVDPPRLEGDVRVARIKDPAGNHLGLWQFAGQ